MKALVSLMLRGVGFAVNLRFLRDALDLLLLEDLPLAFAVAVLPEAGFPGEALAAVLPLELGVLCPAAPSPGALSPEARSGTAIATAQTMAS